MSSPAAHQKKHKSISKLSSLPKRTPKEKHHKLLPQNSTTSGFMPEHELLSNSAVSPVNVEDVESPMVHHLKTHYLTPRKLLPESDHDDQQDISILSQDIIEQERLMKLQQRGNEVVHARANALKVALNIPQTKTSRKSPTTSDFDSSH